jgi:hypothetical protein
MGQVTNQGIILSLLYLSLQNVAFICARKLTHIPDACFKEAGLCFQVVVEGSNSFHSSESGMDQE